MSEREFRRREVDEEAGGFGEFQVKARPTEEVVFVDVGAKSINANILRDGVPVGVHQVDPEVVGPIIAGRPPLPMKVLTQSIAPGTPVPQGTVVDVILTPAFDLPVAVISGTHVDLKQLEMKVAFDRFVAGKPQVNRILARSAGGPLTAEDEAAVIQLFQAEGVEITDQPGRDVGAAVETLRVISTFGR